MSRTILIVEDDAAIAHGLALNLRVEGYEAQWAADGEQGLAEATRSQPDLIVLDLSLPKRNGLDVISALRGAGNRTPILVLSAAGAEADKVAALRLGADDYVTKPFALAELLARVAALLRRAQPAADHEQVVRVGELEIFVERRVVHKQGRELKLTRLEFELLLFLARHAGKVMSRERLLREVWDVSHEGSARTVDNFVAQLRGKIEEDPEAPRHLVTVRGAGYRLDP